MLLKKYILLLCGFLSSAAFAVNLLENGSFEIFSDGKPAKWHQNMPKNFPNVEFKISDKGKSGKYAGQIISNNPATKMNHFIAWIQHIDMKKLEPYTPGKEIMLILPPMLPVLVSELTLKVLLWAEVSISSAKPIHIMSAGKIISSGSNCRKINHKKCTWFCNCYPQVPLCLTM